VVDNQDILSYISTITTKNSTKGNTMKKLLLASALVSTLASVAGAAVTTSGDAGVRWAGTTPELGPDSFCEFKNIVDGTMVYSPPSAKMYGQYTKRLPGFWYTTEFAKVEIESLHAKSIIVEGENTLYLDETATNHGILVDYFPDQTGQVKFSTTNNDPNYQDGLGLTSQDSYYLLSSGLAEYNNAHELQGTVVGGNVNIIGGRNARNRFEIHDIEGGSSAQLSGHGAGNSFTTTLQIAGAAYMLDGNDQPLYDADAAGADENYGMVDGNYHIKHKVTCLQ
jgi:hypothetical protein